MKLAVLSVTCNKPEFLNESAAVEATWGGDIIRGKYKDVVFYTVRSGSYNAIIGNTIYVNTPDDLLHTYDKLKAALKILLANTEVDIVLKTNTSVFANIKNTLRFIEQLGLNPSECKWIGPYGSTFIGDGGTVRLGYTFGMYTIMTRSLINLIVNDDRTSEDLTWYLGTFLRAVDDILIGRLLHEINPDMQIINLNSVNYKVDPQIYQSRNSTNPMDINDLLFLRLKNDEFDRDIIVKNMKEIYQYLG